VQVLSLVKSYRLLIALTVAFCGYAFIGRISRPPTPPVNPAQVKVSKDNVESQQDFTMQDLLNLAESSLDHLSHNLVDYTARFEKIEVNENSHQLEKTVMQLKVQTRFRNMTLDAPRRIYLRFSEPSSVSGREVIWRQDLYNGKMAVHEPGFLLSLKTIWLDPNGILAMQGQRHPISEVGIVKLTEQLIQRGKEDLDNPLLSIGLQTNHKHDDLSTHLITIIKNQTSNIEGDYGRAEIVFDPERNLVLSFRSYATPTSPSDSPQLIESYSYHNLQVNVGLTESDFDVTNEQYDFP